MCMSPSNPQVASAKAAAMGVLTPQPCVPMTTAPWSPGSSTVTVSGLVALNDASTCQCQWGGTLSVRDPSQTTTETDCGRRKMSAIVLERTASSGAGRMLGEPRFLPPFRVFAGVGSFRFNGANLRNVEIVVPIG
jgi:hypothetical protein